MSSLLDQSPLIDLAERLVNAARRAGADAADAVAVRSISMSVEVREGAVEESERAESDDMGLRVLVGKRQAVVSTNDTKGDGADALAERAVGRLNPRTVETRRVPVVFDPRIAGSLVGHFASAINGASIARKTSFLKDRMGERLFRSGIRIVDDPLRKRGLRSRPFDGEGILGNALAVIDDGVLKSWFLDSATARELSLTTTGHAARGVSSSPSPAPTNLHLEPGSQTPQQLIAEIEDGFYVTDLIGMGTNL